MSLATLLRQSVTVVIAGETTDDYNNVVPDWTNPTRTPVLGYLEQTAATEVTVDRDTVVSDWSLVVPTGTAITALDRVEVDGATPAQHGRNPTTYEVVGEPWGVFNPRLGLVSHIQAHLRLLVSG